MAYLKTKLYSLLNLHTRVATFLSSRIHKEEIDLLRNPEERKDEPVTIFYPLCPFRQHSAVERFGALSCNVRPTLFLVANFFVCVAVWKLCSRSSSDLYSTAPGSRKPRTSTMLQNCTQSASRHEERRCEWRVKKIGHANSNAQTVRIDKIVQGYVIMFVALISHVRSTKHQQEQDPRMMRTNINHQ